MTEVTILYLICLQTIIYMNDNFRSYKLFYRVIEIFKFYLKIIIEQFLSKTE